MIKRMKRNREMDSALSAIYWDHSSQFVPTCGLPGKLIVIKQSLANSLDKDHLKSIRVIPGKLGIDGIKDEPVEDLDSNL
jgi:hypothetical protein